MNLSLSFDRVEGKIKAISSKSVAHRLLICAAFADAPTTIRCDETNNDITATAECLAALGARIEYNAPYYTVEPLKLSALRRCATLPCGESGSTLRFLLPVAAAIGADCSFALCGRLPDRPLSPLREELYAHSIEFGGTKEEPCIRGSLSGSDFEIDGSVSSQFVSGLLFALSLLDRDCTLTINGRLESAPYVDITCDALALFGAPVEKCGNVYKIRAKGNLTTPKKIDVEGDWSNAAFPLALGAIGGEIEVLGLNPNSSQGDKAIIDILRRFGADICYRDDTRSYLAKRSQLRGIDIDAAQIPDLVPILATVASVALGKTTIYGASRLRLKESDRLASVCDMLCSIGASAEQTDDGLIIYGKNELCGGIVDSYNDHRIAMSASVAASVCRSDILLQGAEAVKKSYPSFWEEMSKLGLKIIDKTN